MNKNTKRPRRFIMQVYNLVDKIKFHLKIKPKRELLIISGADSSHFKSLLQFIDSVLKYEGTSPLIVYDLGLKEEESTFLKNNFPKVIVRKFEYDRYPSYFNVKIDAGKAAWKPVIMHDVLMEFNKSIVWFDAGCIITQPLYRIRRVIHKHGYYSPVAKDTINEWIHPETRSYLIKKCNIDRNIFDLRILASTVVGINPCNHKTLKLMENWKACAMTKECTAPEGSSKKNNRYQTILAAHAYNLGLGYDIPQRRLGFLNHRDID